MTCVASAPPSVSTTAITSAALMPYRRHPIGVDGDLEHRQAGDLLGLERRRRPGAGTLAATTSSALRRSTSRSSPKILMARSDRTPAISSLTRSSMGWLKPKASPGIPFEGARHRPPPARPSCAQRVQCSCGFSMTMTSLTLTPMGSVAISGRPVFETTVRDRVRETPPAAAARRASPAGSDSSSDTLGRRRIWMREGPLVETRDELGAEPGGRRPRHDDQGRARPRPRPGAACRRHHREGRRIDALEPRGPRPPRAR